MEPGKRCSNLSKLLLHLTVVMGKSHFFTLAWKKHSTIKEKTEPRAEGEKIRERCPHRTLSVWLQIRPLDMKKMDKVYSRSRP